MTGVEVGAEAVWSRSPKDRYCAAEETRHRQVLLVGFGRLSRPRPEPRSGVRESLFCDNNQQVAAMSRGWETVGCKVSLLRSVFDIAKHKIPRYYLFIGCCCSPPLSPPPSSFGGFGPGTFRALFLFFGDASAWCHKLASRQHWPVDSARLGWLRQVLTGPRRTSYTFRLSPGCLLVAGATSHRDRRGRLQM